MEVDAIWDEIIDLIDQNQAHKIHELITENSGSIPTFINHRSIHVTIFVYC